MKKLIYILLFCFCFSANAQTYEEELNLLHSVSNQNQAFDIYDSYGNLFLISKGNGYNDPLQLKKLNSNGVILWQKDFSTEEIFESLSNSSLTNSASINGYSSFFNVILASDDGLICSFNSDFEGNSGEDDVEDLRGNSIIKFDVNGNIEWTMFEGDNEFENSYFSTGIQGLVNITPLEDGSYNLYYSTYNVPSQNSSSSYDFLTTNIKDGHIIYENSIYGYAYIDFWSTTNGSIIDNNHLLFTVGKGDYENPEYFIMTIDLLGNLIDILPIPFLDLEYLNSSSTSSGIIPGPSVIINDEIFTSFSLFNYSENSFSQGYEFDIHPLILRYSSEGELLNQYVIDFPFDFITDIKLNQNLNIDIIGHSNGSGLEWNVNKSILFTDLSNEFNFTNETSIFEFDSSYVRKMHFQSNNSILLNSFTSSDNDQYVNCYQLNSIIDGDIVINDSTSSILDSLIIINDSLSLYVNNLNQIIDSLQSSQENCTIQEVQIPLLLPGGWALFGFTCIEPMDVPNAFNSIIDEVVIVKDANGSAYLPTWDFNGIGDLIYSRGYQIKTTEEVLGFSFCPTIIVSE
jgi:hypothetical protein